MNIMLQKYKKPIIIALIILLVVVLVAAIIYYLSVPRLSQSQMDMIEEALHEEVLWSKNVDGAETFAMQYVGVYGDCVALLAYTSNFDALWTYMSPPIQIDREFFPRPVYLHNNAFIYFYNLKEQKLQTALGLVERGLKWLTDEQIEQLARDIEKIGKKFG